MADQVWSKGPTLSGLRDAIETLRTLLRGRLEVQDGVAITSRDGIDLRIRLVGNVIHVQFEDPKPQAEVNYVFRLLRNIDGVKITDSGMDIQIEGLPDPHFDIVS